MRLRNAFAGFLAMGVLSTGVAVAQTDTSATDNAALLKRLDEQDRRIKELERKLEAQPQGAQASQPASASSPSSYAGSTPSPGVGASVAPAQPAHATLAQQSSSFTGAAPGVPVVATAGPAGYSLQTTDGSSSINFHGNLAVDGRYFSSGAPSSADTWLLRQVRPYIDGTIDKIFDYRLVPDFGNGKTIILDAYVDGRFTPWFVVQAGKFKGPVGLERLQFSVYNRFIELGLPTDLVPNRDLGLQVAGDVGGGLFSYAVGGFDGTTSGVSTDSSPNPDVDNDYGHLDWEGRVFSRPFARTGNFFLKGLGFGIGGTYSGSVDGIPGTAATATAAAVSANPLLTSYRTPGQQVFFSYRAGTTPTYADGERIRWSPQFYYYVGPFGLLGEYAEDQQDVARATSAATRTGTVNARAWQLSAAWFVTGEEETYYGFTPNHPFQIGGPGWGAFELVARVHELDIDEVAFAGGKNSFADPSASARQAHAVGGGVNWWLNQNFRWMLDYEVTTFEGGAKSGNRPDEKALLTRFFLAF